MSDPTPQNPPATPPPSSAAPAPAATPAAPQGRPLIAYEDFAKLDLRVAKVLEVTPHPNADKLIVIKVDLGTEQRQIVAGLRAFYGAETLVGKNIVIVANLQPRKMRGLESNGMLLAATVGSREALEDVVVLTTDRSVPPGAPVS
jgi:methionyl-tRNA synthetase